MKNTHSAFFINKIVGIITMIGISSFWYSKKNSRIIWQSNCTNYFDLCTTELYDLVLYSKIRLAQFEEEKKVFDVSIEKNSY